MSKETDEYKRIEELGDPARPKPGGLLNIIIGGESRVQLGAAGTEKTGKSFGEILQEMLAKLRGR